MIEGKGLRVYHRRKGRVSEEIRRQPKGGGRKGEGRRREEGRGKGEGTGWVKGLLIRRISEEGPISNIKDESNRSKDDLK